MLIKILLLCVVVYLGYRIIVAGLPGAPRARPSVGRPGSSQIDDVMVRDPLCGTFVARRSAVYTRLDGEDLYFCSPECRQRFEKDRQQRYIEEEKGTQP